MKLAAVPPMTTFQPAKKATAPTLPADSICLVDLTGFLHRLAYMPGPHGMKPQTVTSKKTGEPTWGLVGTFNQLNTLAKMKPGRIIAFSDSSQNGFRQDILECYKRKSGSTYIGKQLERLAQCLPFMGIPVIGAGEQFPGMEAEDIISRAAQVLPGNRVIVSYDKDLMQLVEEGVSHYHPQKKELVTAETLDAHLKAQFLPTKAPLAGPDLAVFLAVTGDDVDGVTGIGGVGPATLATLYEKLPPGLSNPEKIEALAKADAEIKAAGGKTVTADWKRALLNLQVTDLRTSQQAAIEVGEIPNPIPNKDAFRQVLEDLTMGSFLKSYDQWFAPFEALGQRTLQPELV